jgi:nucleoside phosphorylase
VRTETRSIHWTDSIDPEVVRAALSPQVRADFEREYHRVVRDFNGPRRDEAFRLTSDENPRKERGPVAEVTVDVLILTALPKELEAVRSNSGPWTKEDAPLGDKKFKYWKTTAYHDLTIAAVGMNRMGPVGAAVSATNAISALHPKRVVLVGICAGIGKGVRLGDICVAESVVDYDLGKVKQGTYSPRWDVFQADPELLNTAKYFADSNWPGSVLTAKPNGAETPPRVHFGTVLTGSKVVADEDMVASLKTTWTQAIGLEMEGGGVAAAAYQHHLRPSMLIVKGVCDRATNAKNDKWQAYAADAAGRYAMALLIERGTPTLKRSPSPSITRPKAPRHDPWVQFGLTVTKVRTGLTKAFDTKGLRLLAQDLRVEWEELENRSTLSGAAYDLIRECEKRHWEEDLLEASAQAKPGENLWAKVDQAAASG